MRSRLSAGMEYAGTVTLDVLASSNMKNQSLLFGSHASVFCSSIPEGLRKAALRRGGAVKRVADRGWERRVLERAHDTVRGP